MARKDFEKYYEECKMNYNLCIECLKNLDEDLQQNPTSEEQINAIKRDLQPAIDAFNFVRGIKHLLDLPNRPRKKRQYLKKNKTPDGDFLERQLAEDKQRIKKNDRH